MLPRPVVWLFSVLAERMQSSVKFNINRSKSPPTDESSRPDIHVHCFNTWLIYIKKKSPTYFSVFFILYVFHVMSPNVFRAHSSGEACGISRGQDGCFCCLLFCGSEEFLKTGSFWLFLAPSDHGCTFSGLSALRGGVSSVFFEN